MANVARVRAEWTGGGIVGPAVSTFYMAEAGSGWTAALTTFFQALVNFVPLGTTVKIPNNGDLLDINTGALSGTWTDGSTGTAVMTGSGVFAAAVGARIRWQTSGLTNGRRVRGSTFIVPIISSQFDGINGLQTSLVTNLTNASNALRTTMGSTFGVYTRPTPSHGGAFHPITGSDVPDTVSWLRSRRT